MIEDRKLEFIKKDYGYSVKSSDGKKLGVIETFLFPSFIAKKNSHPTYNELRIIADFMEKLDRDNNND